MQPPYTITDEILRLIEEVSLKIGEGNASYVIAPSPELRKRNRIKTIHASLAIEGNTLSKEQVTAVLDNKRVIGPSREILEVSNAIRVYKQLGSFNPLSEKDFLKAHHLLMEGLIPDPGQYRQINVGITAGKRITHIAPQARLIPKLMKEIFLYLKQKSVSTLIKSCVFHYELEFIHPFSDGNGRMGRLWQTLLLRQEFPILEYLPFETIISKTQKHYYKALAASDKQGASTIFIEFMLRSISSSLDQFLAERPGPVTSSDRIQTFLTSGVKEFTRKTYMQHFKTISSATASRDLKIAVDQHLVKKTGDKNKTIYKNLEN